MLAWVLSLALGQEPFGLDEASAAFHTRAEQELAEGRFDRAQAYFRLVLRQNPGYVPAQLGLGRALEGAGDRDGAERLYVSLGTEPDAVEALARLVAARDPARALALWRQLQTLRLGDPEPYREEARLTTDPEAARLAWERYVGLLLGAEPDITVGFRVADLLAAAGRAPEGEALLRAWLEAFPDGARAAEVRARLERMEVERLAAALVLPVGEPLRDPAALDAVTGALAEGRLEDAERLARALVAANPRAPAAHGALADVLVARGDWSGAERHATLARDLGSDDAANHLRLGRLYEEAYGGRRAAEAAACFREAAALRPEDPEVLAALAEAEQRLGNWEAAREAWTRVERAAGAGPRAEAARERVAQLGRVPPVLGAVPPGPSAVPAAYRVALVYLRRGEVGKALDEVDQGLADAPASVPLLNLRARLLRQTGDEEGARAALEASLRVDPDQGPVHLALGEIALARGEDARAREHFQAAAARGAVDAWYQIAALDAARGDWTAVRAALRSFEAGGGAGSLYAEAAGALRAEAEGRRRRVQVAVGGGGVLLIGGLVGWGWWRRGAVDLRTFLDRAPGARHEAARLLASLRHEVLKHNTTVLPEVADALERGDTGPWEEWRARAPGIRERFRSTRARLEELAARCGVRVDLGRDPVLGPMEAALRTLDRPDPARVRAASEALNRVGYARIGALVQELGLLVITPKMIEAVMERLGGEPGIAGAPLPELEVRVGERVPAVRLYRDDLDDILANLLRNAVAAGARRIVVRLGEAVDPVSLQGWAEIRVYDDAPGMVTNAMIRSRAISRGLGLAMDLVARHQGTLRVEAAEGGKELVVELPGVEAAPVEVEWTVG